MSSKKVIKSLASLFLVFSMLFTSAIPALASSQINSIEADNQETILFNNTVNPDDVILGEVIVKYKDNRVRKNSTGFSIQEVRSYEYGTNIIKIEPGKNMEQTLEELRNDEKVEYAEPNMKYYIAHDVKNVNSTVSETVYGDVYKDAHINDQWGLGEINVFEAWEQMDDVSGEVTVAVIDTGVDYNHPDLQGRILNKYGKNFAEKKGDGSEYSEDKGCMDDEGHGTFVSGIISAKYQNSIGISGVAGKYNVKILPVKVMNNAGWGATFDIAKGIRYAADKGADVINLSLGSPDYSEVMADAVEYAQDKGVLVVAAAGNSRGDVDNYYPAALPGVLTAGALGKGDNIAKFSNTGDAIDIVAPGVNIISTALGVTDIGNDKEGYYDMGNGTSFAAPYTAGVAALYKLKYPDANPGQIIDAITKGASDIKDSGWDEVSGYGKLNAKNTLNPDYESKMYIKLLSPRRNSYLSGDVNLRAQITKDNDKIDKVVFYLDEISEDKKVAESKNADADIYNCNWDTTNVEDGAYKLIAAAYSENELKDSYKLIIRVMNGPKSGIVLNIKDPDGNKAISSNVSIYEKRSIKDEDTEEVINYYKELWAGKTSNEGVVRVPNITIDDLNELYVLVEGRFDFKDASKGNTLFIYQRNIQGPGIFEINGEDTVPVKIKTVDKNDKEIINARYYVTVADKDGLNIGTTAPMNEYENGKPLEQSPTIYMDKGKYDLFAYHKAEEETYFLSHFAEKITNDTKEILFDGKDTGEVSLNTENVENKIKDGYLYLFNDSTEASIGIKLEGNKVLVSADYYDYKIDGEVADPKGGENWIYTFESDENGINVKAGEESAIEVGGNIEISDFSLDYDWFEEWMGRMGKEFNREDIKEVEPGIFKIPRKYMFGLTKIKFSDSHGNALIAVNRGSLSKDEILSNDNLASIQIESTFNPTYEVTFVKDNSDVWGNEHKNFYTNGFWSFFFVKELGDYKVELSLKQNPLAPNGLSSSFIERIYDSEFHTMKVTDGKEKIYEPYTEIFALEKDKKGNYSWNRVYGLWCERWEEEDLGLIAVDSGTKLSNIENGNVAVFRFEKENGENAVIFRSFTSLDELPEEIVVKPDKLQRVTVKGVDKEGKDIAALQPTRNILYPVKVGENNDEVMLRWELYWAYKNGMWIEEGQYGFDIQFLTTADENGKHTNYYIIKDNVDINNENNEVILNAANTAKVNINADIEGYNSIKGIALMPYSKYGISMSGADCQGDIFYVPADVDFNNVVVQLALSDPEDSSLIWNYILKVSDKERFNKNQEKSWNIGGEFKPSVNLSKTRFKVNDNITGKVSITDEYNNRLLQTFVTQCYSWINEADNKKIEYYRNINGEIIPRLYSNEGEVNIESIELYGPVRKNPHLRIYEDNKKVFDKSKNDYYREFNEKIQNMKTGSYRAELAFSNAPKAPIISSKDEGLFTVYKESDNHSKPSSRDKNKDNNKDSDKEQISTEQGSITIEEDKNGNKKLLVDVDTKKVKKMLTDEKHNEITIDAAKDKDINNVQVKMDSNFIEKAVENSKNIKIQTKDVMLEMDPSSLDIKKKANVKLGVKKFSEKDAKEIIKKINSHNYDSVSYVYDFDLTENVNGKDKKLIFDKPMTISMKIDSSNVSNIKKVGVYYLNEETNDWEYVGGKVNKDGTITFTIKHFSKYTAMEYNKKFTDVNIEWAKEQIEVLASRHIVDGVDGENYLPMNNLTRAEFAKMLVYSLNLKYGENKIRFIDVKNGDWYKEPIEMLASLGIFNGNGNKANPNARITREEMATLLIRALEYVNPELKYIQKVPSFTDSTSISDWAYRYVNIAYNTKLMNGVGNNEFAPQENATRAEAAVVIYRLLEMLGRL